MGWRSKFVFVLMVYFAGFATAVYCLAPPPVDSGTAAGKPLLGSALRSDQFVQSFNSGMHKAIDLGKDAAMQAAQLIQEKAKEAQAKAQK
jgi:hypothetical protein